jgi:hypothetical protein
MLCHQGIRLEGEVTMETENGKLLGDYTKARMTKAEEGVCEEGELGGKDLDVVEVVAGGPETEQGDGEFDIYDFQEAPIDNTMVAQIPEGASNGHEITSHDVLGAANSVAGTAIEKVMKETSEKTVAYEKQYLKNVQKRAERYNRSGRGENYKPLQRNLNEVKTSTARQASARALGAFARFGVPIAGAAIGGAIEYNASISSGKSTGLAASRAAGSAVLGTAGAILAGAAVTALGLNPIGWMIAAGIIGSTLGATFGGYLYGKFGQ